MEITNEKLFKILKNNLILIIACGVLFFGIAYAYSKFFVVPTYYSESKFTIKSEATSDINTTADLTLARQLVATYIEILNSDNFFKVVHEELPDAISKKYSVKQLREWTTFSPVGNTEIIKLNFSCPDKEYAQPITAAIVSSVSMYFNSSSYDVSCWTTEDATEARLSSDKTVIYSVIGFVFGMILVYIIALLREILDIRVKTVKDLMDRYDLPVLGSIPAFKGKILKKEDS
ncbi:MAG: Wzz/FepE/Etk N-terminal domain-containing protein [Eubacteriales bacterium]|nr:Wzz/FepE/Etk N-terminal domain-containing protein [Eubacteriales bacterium]MDD4422126.1 Wzz/FepE/Etk N-terminal domain-containing protein [Eubacteriales bacterium]HBR30661.1 hypothetical protein [Clostridiales bacterium]